MRKNLNQMQLISTVDSTCAYQERPGKRYCPVLFKYRLAYGRSYVGGALNQEPSKSLCWMLPDVSEKCSRG
jgi:hypothetical protein